MAKSSTANRGMKFESLIQKKCDELKKNGVALISKVPTEFKMIRGVGGKVTSAYPVSESKFVDFVGVMNNKAIAIEAKETKNKTNFPFSNIKESQIRFLDLWEELGGLGYYIIRFVENKKVFLIQSNIMNNCIRNIGRKSAPYNWFLETDGVVELDYKKLNFEEHIALCDNKMKDLDLYIHNSYLYNGFLELKENYLTFEKNKKYFYYCLKDDRYYIKDETTKEMIFIPTSLIKNDERIYCNRMQIN